MPEPVEDEFDADVEDVDADATDEDEDGEEETIESLKARLAKADAALKKANKQSERLRLKTKATPAKKAAAAAADEDDTADKTDTVAHARAVRQAARAGLREAGFTGTKERLVKLLRLIDTDDVEFDDEDEADGLDDQIEDLKSDFPELFKSADEDERDTRGSGTGTARKRVPAGVNANAGRSNRSGTVKTASEQLAAQMLGTARRR